jgi:hypothetical protein
MQCFMHCYASKELIKIPKGFFPYLDTLFARYIMLLKGADQLAMVCSSTSGELTVATTFSNHSAVGTGGGIQGGGYKKKRGDPWVVMKSPVAGVKLGGEGLVISQLYLGQSRLMDLGRDGATRGGQSYYVELDTTLGGGDRHGVSEGEMTADGRINVHLVSNYHRIYDKTGALDWELMAEHENNLPQVPKGGSPRFVVYEALNDQFRDGWIDGNRVLLGATAFPDVDSMKLLGNYAYCIQFMNRRLFELVSFGSNCGCRRYSLVFGWRGSGKCRACLVEDGMAVTNRSIEGYTRGLLRDGIVEIAHKGMKVLCPEMVRLASAGGGLGDELIRYAEAARLFAILLAPVPVNILEMARKNPALWAFGYMRNSMRMAVRLADLHRNEELRKALPSKLLSLLMAVADFRTDDSILRHGAVYNGHKYDWDWLTNGMGRAWLGDDGLFLNGPFDVKDGCLVGSVQ